MHETELQCQALFPEPHLGNNQECLLGCATFVSPQAPTEVLSMADFWAGYFQKKNSFQEKYDR